MTAFRHIALPVALLSSLLALTGCTTMGDASSDIPDDAVPTTRTESNGDVVTEYRVGGQLRVVKIEPSRGPAYYLYDRDGDGTPDKEGDNPPQTYFKLFGWK
jgi:uncharacterized protein DUF2782